MASEVGQVGSFKDAVFMGPVVFVAAMIGGEFNIKAAQFLSEEYIADFNSLKVVQNAHFSDAIFMGPVGFVTADINGECNFDGAQFLSENFPANFSGLKVGGEIYFSQTNFKGPVSFDGAHIGTEFSCYETWFQHPGKTVRFDRMKVDQLFVLENVFFKSNIDISYGNFMDLILIGTGEDIPDGQVNLFLRGTKVQRELTSRNSNFQTLRPSISK